MANLPHAFSAKWVFGRSAITPMGRTGRVLPALWNQNVQDNLSGALSDASMTYAATFFLPLLGFWLFTQEDGIGPVALAAVALILLIAWSIYMRACWTIRRLHDLGRSGWAMAIPAAYQAGRSLVLLTSLAAPLLAIVLFVESHTGEDIAQSGRLYALFALAVALPLATISLYEWAVFRPHRNRWIRTVILAPGEPGPNRYGPAR